MKTSSVPSLDLPKSDFRKHGRQSAYPSVVTYPAICFAQPHTQRTVTAVGKNGNAEVFRALTGKYPRKVFVECGTCYALTHLDTRRTIGNLLWRTPFGERNRGQEGEGNRNEKAEDQGVPYSLAWNNSQPAQRMDANKCQHMPRHMPKDGVRGGENAKAPGGLHFSSVIQSARKTCVHAKELGFNYAQKLTGTDASCVATVAFRVSVTNSDLLQGGELANWKWRFVLPGRGFFRFLRGEVYFHTP
eukprot:5398946-Pyramimonas_sp.AAC.1